MTTPERSANVLYRLKIAGVTSSKWVPARYLGMPSVLSLAPRSARSDHLRLIVLPPVAITAFPFDGCNIRGVCEECLFWSYTTFDCDLSL